MAMKKAEARIEEELLNYKTNQWQQYFPSFIYNEWIMKLSEHNNKKLPGWKRLKEDLSLLSASSPCRIVQEQQVHVIEGKFSRCALYDDYYADVVG
jgi:hypothetical protein